MQIGFIGLGAVVETAYLPALRRLGDVIDRCRAMTGLQQSAAGDPAL
ncbi:hypothetical protein KPZU09_74370 [Klebsiella pneumoniae]|uniref:Uncharacterized protein n=1 Tax=Klebsiella pneumoniae TaxID=573 RepID=A0A919LSM9_KLEPN|nr:hypothetical protein KPZU09_74370 [Klebsiella pneumoniae]